jgi:hypothetical protein
MSGRRLALAWVLAPLLACTRGATHAPSTLEPALSLDGVVDGPAPPGGTPALAAVGARCDGTHLAPRQLRRLTRRELEATIRDVFPQISAAWRGVDLGADPVSPIGFANDASGLVVGEQTAREILKTAKDVAALVTDGARLPAILPCAATTADAACAARFVDLYGPRLYRRPLTAEERDELLANHVSVSARAGFAKGLQWTLVAMLQSPALLYRSELGGADGRLDAHELATELAYTYGGGPPSAALLDEAARGGLSTPQALADAARALLATPRGKDAFMEFFRQWTGYERVEGADRAGVGRFTTDVAPRLAEETRRFFDALVVDGQAGVPELLTSPVTFLDASLASFYGYGDADAGDGFSATTRPPGRGIGLLAQASILAARSHYDFTSPTFRGLFVYSQLLCHQPQPRPANVHPVTEQPAAHTTRERYESEHESGACAGCHQQFEPFGYGLERFDPTGRYRENENGYALDTHASVRDDATATYTFDGLEDLARELAARPEVTDCVSGLLATYVFSGAGGQTCLAEDARARLTRGELGLRDYYLSLATAPSFYARRP